MPPIPPGVWTNTPNKKDHNTKGYTTKVLLNYQVATTQVAINSGDYIIETLLSNNLNIKGSNLLNRPYFVNADGRCLKISMYFLKECDGIDVNLDQLLIDIDNGYTYIFSPVQAGNIDSHGGYSLVKYECYLSVFYDINNSQYAAQANASFIYPSQAPVGNATMMQMSTSNVLSDGQSNFKIDIQSLNGAKIYPISLMIEEIS